MIALTLWQPWASAIATGYKRFETRTWHTKHRGLLAIHAGRNTSTDALDEFRASPWKPEFGAIENGCIVAVAELVACHKIVHEAGGYYIHPPGDAGGKWGVPHYGSFERRLGSYRAGRYAWELQHVIALPAPVYCGGRQGLWTPSERVAEKVAEQIKWDGIEVVEYRGL